MKENKIEEMTTEETEFKREIGVFGGISIIGGIMIGSGIFYLGSYVLERVGYNLHLSLLAWIIGGLVTLLGGLCFAELGVSIPRAGGATVYLTEAFHPVVGFLRGFTDWVIGGPGSVAAMAIALPTAMRSFFEISDMQIKIIASVLIIALTIYNIFGIKQGAILQNISMVAKVLPLVIIMVAAIIVGNQNPDLSFQSVKEMNVGTGKIISMIAFATVASLWAYEGWTNLNNMTEEIKEPSKNLPRALILGIGGITILYTLFNFAIMKVVPYDEMVQSIKAGDLYLGTKAASMALGSAGAVIVSIAMALAMFGGMNGLIIAQPRMYYAMAVEGHFFKSFKELHPKYKTPVVPLIVQMVFSLFFVFSRSLDELTSLVVFTAMIFNFLVIVAVIVMRKKYPNLERPYKVFLYPFTVILTAILFAGLMINTLFDDPKNAILGLLVQVVGIIVYFIFDRKLKKEGKI